MKDNGSPRAAIEAMTEAQKAAVKSLKLAGQWGFTAGCNLASYLHWEDKRGISVCLGEDVDQLLRMGILKATKQTTDLPEPITKGDMEFQADHWLTFTDLGQQVRAILSEPSS